MAVLGFNVALTVLQVRTRIVLGGTPTVLQVRTRVELGGTPTVLQVRTRVVLGGTPTVLQVRTRVEFRVGRYPGHCFTPGSHV